MTLSEAIRLGAMLGRQTFGYAGHGNDACAMKSAALALGRDYFTAAGWLYIEYPWLATQTACPVCAKSYDAVNRMVAQCLNDTHRWTREAIADWVATVEPTEASSSALALTEALR